ncbi:hypothetical protein CL176_06170 [Suicoccus acidiformans]|uniref:Transposase IS116/IS110/IS902 C-terminal domain-containing protein n=1 Tax=Suicoccus acidiformans TaxID=2036206 RepID=A0A347WKK7_9LACT|nr:transposase [Suicoccus acidiformans]AXY25614.1 hypothetical protein CL176_06170 [Suicoccus acidiformans]
MSTTDRMLLDDSLDEYRFYTKKIAQISKEIEAYILNHFPEEYDLLMIIPGMKAIGAVVILGEIGPDVDAFASAAKLASWEV